MRHARPCLPALCVLGLVLGAGRPAWALLPPQYVVWSKVKATIGTTPGVKVVDLKETDDGCTVVVEVKDAARAEAIASILPPSYPEGNVTVVVKVAGADGKPVKPVVPKTADQLAGFFKAALKDNPAFKDVVVKPAFDNTPLVYPVFTKSVVQVPNGDLSDLYGNFNGVTADVYTELLLAKPGGISVQPTTTK